MTFFKDIGKGIKSGGKSVGHLLSNSGKKVEGAISDVYHDGRSAVSYAGKHVINDVDNISSALSSPLFLYGVLALGALFLIKSR